MFRAVILLDLGRLRHHTHSVLSPKDGFGMLVAAEPALHQGTGGGLVRDPAVAGPIRQFGDVVAAQDQLHGATRHRDAAPYDGADEGSVSDPGRNRLGCSSVTRSAGNS